uniref:Uncharacterized protein n=1 Tax=Mantoniella antarctica TaxID=81844 RepID=A0A7S0SDW3_9CHLO
MLMIPATHAGDLPEPGPNPAVQYKAPPQPPGTGGAGVPDYYLRATLLRLAATLEERFKEAERKIQRARSLAAHSTSGPGGKHNVHDEIGRLESRLEALAAAGRKLGAQAGSAAGSAAGPGSNASPTPVTHALVAQLETQERHMAAWFADLQWQLEDIFTSQQSRMPVIGGGGGTQRAGGGESTPLMAMSGGENRLGAWTPGGSRGGAGTGGGTWR